MCTVKQAGEFNQILVKSGQPALAAFVVFDVAVAFFLTHFGESEVELLDVGVFLDFLDGIIQDNATVLRPSLPDQVKRFGKHDSVHQVNI
jgi:hypothetical protein